MDKRTLGANGPAVSAIGLGCMGMSDFYGPADRKQCIETVHHALSIGMTFFNTGDFYGMGHNEMLLGEALSGGRREKAFISVKYGGMRDPSGAWMGFDLKPNSTKNFLAYTLKRLNTDYIDLYQPCRVSMDIPIEETVGAIADLVKAGYVRYLGLSEANSDAIKRAHKVHPVTALEVEYSIFDRHIEKELPVLNELGIGLVVGVIAAQIGQVLGQDLERRLLHAAVFFKTLRTKLPPDRFNSQNCRCEKCLGHPTGHGLGFDQRVLHRSSNRHDKI